MPYRLDPVRKWRKAARRAVLQHGAIAWPSILNRYPLHYHIPCWLWNTIKRCIDAVRTKCWYCTAIRLFLIGYLAAFVIHG